MQTLLFIGAAFVMGMIMSIYLPMNSSVSRYLGSSIAANVTFFLVAFITSLLILFFSGDTGAVYRFRQVPVYLYLTGFISAFIVLGTTFLIPYLGARKFFILLIAGQVGMAIVVSHFGILESPPDPISARKLAGAVLVIAGAMISVS
jgi:bacterial/archaeal transporter family-2 protein